jgi:hypothetical protein
MADREVAGPTDVAFRRGEGHDEHEESGDEGQ